MFFLLPGIRLKLGAQALEKDISAESKDPKKITLDHFSDCFFAADCNEEEHKLSSISL